MTGTKKIAIFCLILAAFSLSVWSIIMSPTPLSKTITYSAKDADSFMKHIIATIYNVDGAMVLKIVSPKITHFSENDKSAIETPHLSIFRQTPEPWVIDAMFANTKNGLEEILFLNNVKIQHLADAENPNTSLETNSLLVLPQKQIAQTKEAVTFKQPDTTIHSVGMKANLETGSIQLLSEAKGEYAPIS